MACNPVEIFAFANWLMDTRNKTPSSILIRTIINRAYYAALISARDLTGAKTTGKGGHRQVVTALKKVNSNAGNKLDSLRLLRQKADYEMGESFTERDAFLSLHSARLVIVASHHLLGHGKTYTGNYLDKNKFI